MFFMRIVHTETEISTLKSCTQARLKIILGLKCNKKMDCVANQYQNSEIGLWDMMVSR